MDELWLGYNYKVNILTICIIVGIAMRVERTVREGIRERLRETDCNIDIQGLH